MCILEVIHKIPYIGNRIKRLQSNTATYYAVDKTLLRDEKKEEINKFINHDNMAANLKAITITLN